MANIYFKCSCEKVLAVDEAGVGRKIICPDCCAPITVPIPNIHWNCSCGSIMLAPNSLSEQTVQCYDCKTKSQVPISDKSKTTRILIHPKT
jgi:hypothetical protein